MLGLELIVVLGVVVLLCHIVGDRIYITPLYTPGERIRRLGEAREIARRLFTQ